MNTRAEFDPSNAAGYKQRLAEMHSSPLWEALKGMVPNEPRPAAQPFAWRWSQMRDRLLEAGDFISAEEAERRVLMLGNPGMSPQPYVTDTLYAGLQLILPGEVARAHRHSQSALRFVLEGEGGYTSVDGVRTEMHRGDFILTPPWVWHDHGNDGTDPVMWLDGLDVPLVTFLRASFREDYESEQYPSKGNSQQVSDRFMNALLPIEHKRVGLSSPIFNYPYDRTREVLGRLAQAGDMDACHGVNVRYSNPLDGGAPMPTISASMRLVPSGHTTDWFRSVEGAIVVGVESTVTIEIDGTGRFDVAPNDVFAVPGWMRWRMSAGAGADAVLFSYSDKPVFEKLGLYRERRG